MKMKAAAFTDKMILVRGGGDLATGVIHKLHQSGYQVLILECDRPSAIRRHVAFCEAVYDGTAEVEGVVCRRITENDIRTQCRKCWVQGEIPLLTDTHGKYIRELEPEAVIDAILAKKNLGTRISDAPLVIGIGPGFTAAGDCHFVIETQRGEHLGEVIREGSAIPNTGIPGNIGGYTVERLLKASADGIMHPVARIGDVVKKGQIVARCGDEPVYARLHGIVRGMLQEGVPVKKGLKIGDVDARIEGKLCYTISDKARKFGNGVAEAIDLVYKTK